MKYHKSITPLVRVECCREVIYSALLFVPQVFYFALLSNAVSHWQYLVMEYKANLEVPFLNKFLSCKMLFLVMTEFKINVMLQNIILVVGVTHVSLAKG